MTPQNTPEVDGIPQLSVEQYKAKVDAAEQNQTAKPFLLDVREPHEYQIVNLGAPLIPLGQLPERVADIPVPRDAEVVVHCKSGGRSQKAALALKQAGFTNVSNLAGGITAWAEKIDTSLPKY